MKPMLITFWIVGTVCWGLFVIGSFLGGADWVREYLLMMVYRPEMLAYSAGDIITAGALMMFVPPAVVYLVVWMMASTAEKRPG